MHTKKIVLFILFTIPILCYSQEHIKTVSFTVSGSCGMCKDRIETTMLYEKATKAQWDIKTHILTISFDSTKTNKQHLQKKLAEVGHDNGDYKATDEVYNNLPACCHYERASSSIKAKTTHFITGIVLEETIKGKLNPIANATIKSLHSNEYFTTDSTGIFKIASEIPTHLAISYVGFKSDTFSVTKKDMLTIILKNAVSGTLQEIVVTSRNPSAYISSLSIANTLNLGAKELTKAACCNLSESFETSPAVDVSYSDAVTGIKQIQMLGLSGNYTQLLTENAPEIKGLPGSFGLTFIPGPWVESIQLTKGTGSIVNGYESMTSQINIEERKPDDANRFYINSYANSMGRLEANILAAHKFNSSWSTGLLTHVNGVTRKNDVNNDNFIDVPIGRQFNIINRWKYIDNNGWIIQLALKALNDKRQAGEIDFDPKRDKLTINKYGVGMDNTQYVVTSKLGYIFPNHKYKSIGLIVSANQFENNSYYGLRTYDAKQKSFYANLIYQSIIGNTNHKFRTGFSFSNDNYKETLITQTYSRTEIVPGAFFEYTYTPLPNLSAIAGLRWDYHNQFGNIATPRLNIKYDITTLTNLRFSAGSGFRVANIFAENTGLFASSRTINIVNTNNDFGYGLDPEKSWNYGLSLAHNFKLNQRKGSIVIDGYYTTFKNQSIIDIDQNPQYVFIYNLSGKSYSKSLQAELNYELFDHFDVRMAYRWIDVKSTYQNKLLEKPLVAKHRAFLNLAYATHSLWKFDYTVQWIGKKRLPNTSTNPINYRNESYSPGYFQMMAQVTKVIKNIEVYVGSENLTNFIQERAILSANEPFGPFFDASMIWGPVSERMFYIGMRLKIS